MQSQEPCSWDPAKPDTDKFNNPIAWFETDSKMLKLVLEYLRGGGSDFLPYLYPARLSKSSISIGFQTVTRSGSSFASKGDPVLPQGKVTTPIRA
jgi:hypothetical protein